MTPMTPDLRSRGFTLIELLVALGALAFVAVGIAAIFESTGRTISAGKRVSAFSTYAATIQQQMGADIAAMTGDGFLVIRNEYAGSATPASGQPDPVPLFDGDTRPRPRRVDQFMFFAKGKFTTARDPLSPAFIATAEAARVWYGHGQRAVPDTSANSRFLQPTPVDGGDVNERAAAFPGNAPASITNPNRFASDWTLLRHVTLLAAPRSTLPARPAQSILGIGATSARLLDSATQIALQPAARSIFRRLNAQPGPTLLAGNAPQLVRTDYTTAQSPTFTSGIVDIAATDLGQIRSITTTADTWPRITFGASGTLAQGSTFYNAQDQIDGRNTGADGKFRIVLDPSDTTTTDGDQDGFIVPRMQAWMDNAWPASVFTDEQNQNQPRERVRYEPAPPGLLAASSTGSALENAFRRADQAMLASGNFLPRCTEFIVEWSFGKTFPTDPTAPGYNQELAGRTIWHGMERWTKPRPSAGFNPRSTNPDTIPEVFPYIENYAQRPVLTTAPATGPSNALARAVAFVQNVPLNNGSFKPFYTKAVVIHGQDFVDPDTLPNPIEPLTSYFGYTDPTFQPDGFGGTPIEPADGSLSGNLDAKVPTVPWAWPRLIRVTLSLADPGDPAFEQTFQFIFEVPAKTR